MKKYLPFAFGLAIFAAASAPPVLAQTSYHPRAPRQDVYPNATYPNAAYPNPVQTTGSGSNGGMRGFGYYAAGQ